MEAPPGYLPLAVAWPRFVEWYCAAAGHPSYDRLFEPEFYRLHGIDGSFTYTKRDPEASEVELILDDRTHQHVRIVCDSTHRSEHARVSCMETFWGEICRKDGGVLRLREGIWQQLFFSEWESVQGSLWAFPEFDETPPLARRAIADWRPSR